MKFTRSLLPVLLALLFSARAGEALTRWPQSVVAPNEVIDNDLLLVGDSVDFEGTVHGDLIVLAKTATIHGHVTGDLLGIVQDIRIGGRIDGSARGLGWQTTTVEGNIGKDLDFGGLKVEVLSTATIGRDTGVIGYKLSLSGRMAGTLSLGGQEATLDGDIHGPVEAGLSRLIVGSHAVVNAPLTCQCEQPPVVSHQARFDNGWKDVRPHDEPKTSFSLPLLLPLLLALVLLLWLPGWLPQAGATTFRRPVASFLTGLALLPGILVIGLLLTVLLLNSNAFEGVWMGMALIAMLCTSLLAGLMASAAGIGALICDRRQLKISAFMQVLVGMAVLIALDLLPLTAGLAPLIILVPTGLGALALSVKSARLAPGTPLLQRLREECFADLELALTAYLSPETSPENAPEEPGLTKATASTGSEFLNRLAVYFKTAVRFLVTELDSEDASTKPPSTKTPEVPPRNDKSA